MMRPRTQTLVVGHPVVTVPLLGLTGFMGYVFTDSQGFGWGTLAAIVFASWVAKCSGVAARYRAWRREWDALDPHYQPPQPIRKTLLFIRGILVAGAILAAASWLIANYSDPNSAAHWIAPLIIPALLALWVLAWITRWRTRRVVAPKDFVVTQAIARPLPAPSVAEAYARLPDHCRPLLSTEPA